MKTRWALVGVILSLGLVTPSVFALGMNLTGGFFHFEEECREFFAREREEVWERKGLEHLRGLGLTRAQKRKIDPLRSAFQKQMIELKARLKSLKIDLRDLLLDPGSDERKIAKKVQEISEIMTKMLERKVEFQLSLRKILTREQIEKLYSRFRPWCPRWHRRP